MIIKCLVTEDFNTLMDFFLYGQSEDKLYAICETSEAPEFNYEELDESFSDFSQTCVNGKLFQSIDNSGEVRIRKPSVAELKTVLEKVDYVGQKALTVETLGELELLVQLKNTEARADEQDLLLFEIIMGGGVV